MEILKAIILGSFFGFALYKVGATNPKKLKSMLKLEDLTLAKVILFAIGLSSVLLVVINSLGLFNIDNLNVKSMNLGVILGGLIFGIGFGYVGTCPGTCVGASGTNGFKKGLSSIIGGLVGAFTFSMLYESLKSSGIINALDMGKLTLFNISSEYEAVFNIGFSGLLITGVIFIVLALILPKSIIKK